MVSMKKETQSKLKKILIVAVASIVALLLGLPEKSLENLLLLLI